MQPGNATDEDNEAREAILLSVTRAAGRLGLSRSYMYERVRRGEIRSVKCGARRLIPADAVVEFASTLEP